MELISEIRAAINRCNREHPSNTPDFILSEYLLSCLEAFEVASLQREEWYGQHLSIKVNALLDTKDGKAHPPTQAAQNVCLSFDEALSLINRGEWALAESKLRELRQTLRASA